MHCIKNESKFSLQNSDVHMCLITSAIHCYPGTIASQYWKQ